MNQTGVAVGSSFSTVVGGSANVMSNEVRDRLGRGLAVGSKTGRNSGSREEALVDTGP